MVTVPCAKYDITNRNWPKRHWEEDRCVNIYILSWRTSRHPVCSHWKYKKEQVWTCSLKYLFYNWVLSYKEEGTLKLWEASEREVKIQPCALTKFQDIDNISADRDTDLKKLTFAAGRIDTLKENLNVSNEAKCCLHTIQ